MILIKTTQTIFTSKDNKEFIFTKITYDNDRVIINWAEKTKK